MTAVSLQDDVEIILEKSALASHHDVKSRTGGLIKMQPLQQAIASDAQNYELIHRQAAHLKKLFFQSNKVNQQEIINMLISKLENGGEISRTAALTLLEVGNANILIGQIRDNYVGHTQDGYFASVNLLNGYLYYFWPRFNLAQVRELREWARQAKQGTSSLGKAASTNPMAYSRIMQVVWAIYNQTTHILASDVETRIDAGYNPEINEDREELKKEVSRFGFPPDLSETLDKIDLKFTQAHDAFDFKGCMDLIRAFTERLYQSILDSYGPDGKKVDATDSEAVVKFFESKGLISNHFGTMVAKLRHFLSDQASHRLKSREEDARLSKNMVIEMSLYLLRRYENH